MANKFIIPIFLLLIFSCKSTDEKETNEFLKSDQIKVNFDGLLGEWFRTNDAEAKQTYERWKKISETEYSGFSCTVEDRDTIWQEDILLIKRDSLWTYEVTGKGDSIPVIFTLTKIDSSGFVSENPQHDFPKKIRYEIERNKMNAVISDDENEVRFEFEKIIE